MIRLYAVFVLVWEALGKFIPDNTPTLLPEVPNSVDPFRTNMEAIANYTFHFRSSSQIQSKPRFTITFPDIFPSIFLNNAECKAIVTIVLTTEWSEIDCSVNGNIVEVDVQEVWGSLDSGYIMIELANVLNPSGVGQISSGNFYLRSWSGEQIVVDFNLAFEPIAFAPVYTSFTQVQLANDGSQVAGYVTNYIVSFKSGRDYSSNVWFRLHVPSEFEIQSGVKCLFGSLSEQVSCTRFRNVLFIKNFTQPFTASTLYQIKIVGIRNPTSSTTQSTSFIFESLEYGVNTVIDFADNVPGVAIVSGQITQVTVIGFPLVQNLFVDYSIRFLPTNPIPELGGLRIDFPSTFQGLASSCRVVAGLSPAPGKQEISCVSVGNSLLVTDFAQFIPQFITVKSYAYNPPVRGPTPQFQVSTYTSAAMSNLIDENRNAGSVTISSIGKPNFVAFDFYTQIFNCTFNEVCTIDFRLYPNVGNQLGSSSSSNYAQIDLQIPHWWRLSGNSSIPQCLFGTDSAYQCWQREGIFSIQTPSIRGLSLCDLPVSIKYSTVTPIPGRYPWRVLTFANGGKWNSLLTMISTINQFATPIEQDTFVMDIPYASIPIIIATASSSQSGDPDNLIQIRSNVEPFDISYEGAINLNFTLAESNLLNKAAWEAKVGFTLPDSSSLQIPCKVYISGSVAGYLNTYLQNHKDVRCHVRAGNTATGENTLIQVVGFSRNILKGEYFNIFIPNVKFCTTVGRLCKLTVSYTMTQDLDLPYVLNSREIVFGQVTSAPAILPSSISGLLSKSSDEKCASINLSIRFNNLSADLLVGDYVIIKRVYSHWYFTNTNSYNVQIPSSPVVTVTSYPVWDFYNDLEYIIVPITSQVSAGNNKVFTLVGVRNSPYVGNESIISAVVYANKIKIARGVFPFSNQVLGGGIFTPNPSWELSDYHGNRGGRMIQGYNHPFKVNFINCFNIPDGGEIIVSFSPTLTGSNNYVSFDHNCTTWETVQRKMANESHPFCGWDESIPGFRIRNFEAIDKMTSITLQFYGILNTVFSPLQIRVQTFNVSGDASTQVDYIRGAPITTTNTAIPRTLPPLYNFIGWKSFKYELYLNDRGYLRFHITTGHNMPYTLAEDNYFEFTFDKTITLNSMLECRYGEYPENHRYPSVQCDFIAGATSNTIRMRLHPALHIQASTRYTVIIDTRDKEFYEGLGFTAQGIRALSVYSYVGGVVQRTGKSRVYIQGPKIDHFFIHSSNKVAQDWTLFSLFFDMYTNTFSIGNSDVTQTTYEAFVVFFETANSGFDMDLGTGLPELTTFPCTVQGLTLLPTKDRVDCSLYYGYNMAPTKVEITGFAATTTSTFAIRFPLIKNPVSLKVPRITVQRQRRQVVAGVKVITVLHEGYYNELNITYTKHAEYTFSPLTVTLSTPVTHTATKLETKGNLRLPVNSPMQLKMNDMVAFKFPIFWPLNPDVSKADCPDGFVQDCYSISNVAQGYFLLVFKLGGNMPNPGAFTVRVVSPAAVIPVSPAPVYPIESYLFKNTRLIRITNLINFSGVVMTPDVITAPTVDCEQLANVEGTTTNYIISFSLPYAMLAGGQLRIDATDYTKESDFCFNTANSNLKGDFACAMESNYAHAQDFESLNANLVIELKAPFINPAYSASTPIHKWRIRAYYLATPLFYFLKADSGLFNHLSPKCNVLSASSVVATGNQLWAQMRHADNHTRTATYGPINLITQFDSDIVVDDTYEVEVTFSRTDFVQQNAEFVAIWNQTNFARGWTTAHTAANYVFIVKLMKVGNINSAYEHTLTLTTLNAQNNINGFLYPANQGIYPLTAKFSQSGSLLSTTAVGLRVYKTNFDFYEVRSLVSNAGFKNFLYYKLQSSLGFPGGSTLQIRLPTVSFNNNGAKTLFADDAGSGLSSGASVPCYIKYSGGRLLPACTFTPGSRLTQTAATVTAVMPVTGIAATEAVTLVLDGMVNPSGFGDSQHIEGSVEQWSGGTHRFTGIDYDFTLIRNLALVQITQAAEPTFTSSQIGDTNISFDIAFRCSEALKVTSTISGFGDLVLIEFPYGYSLSVTAGTEAKTNQPGSAKKVLDIFPRHRVAIFTPDVAIPANTQITLSLFKVDQAKLLNSDAIFHIHCVTKRVVVTTNTYPTISTYAASAPDSTKVSLIPLDDVSTGYMTRKMQRFKLTFQVPATVDKVPAGGVFTIALPASLSPAATFCDNDATSKLTPASGFYVSCVYDSATSTYIISNFQDFLPLLDAILIFSATTPTTPTALSITLTAYADSTQRLNLMQASIPVSSSYVFKTQSGFAELAFSSPGLVTLDALRVGGSSALNFWLTLPGSWAAGSTFTLTLPGSVSLPSGSYMRCLLGVVEAKCRASGSPVIVTLEAPTFGGLVAGSKIEVKISPVGGTGSGSGFLFSSSGLMALSSTYMGVSSGVEMEVLPSDFTSSSIRINFANSGLSTAVYFRLTLGSNVPSGGSIVFSFPLKDAGGSTIISPLATWKQSTIILRTCMNLSPTTLTGRLKCIYGAEKGAARFSVEGFNALSSGSTIEIAIDDLTLATVTGDTTIASAEAETRDSSGNVLNKRVFFDLLSISPTTIASTTAGTTIAASSVVLRASNVQLTFTGVSVTSAMGALDQVVFSFPSEFFFANPISNCGGAAGSYFSLGRQLIFSSSTGLAVGTFNFCAGNLAGPAATPSVGVTVSLVYGREARRQVRFNLPTFTKPTTSVVSSMLTATAGTKNVIQLSIDFSFGLDGPARITLGLGTLVFIDFSVVGGLPTFTYAYDSTTKLFTISFDGPYSKAVNGVIVVSFTVVNPAASTVSLAVNIYEDPFTVAISTVSASLVFTGSAPTLTCALGSQSGIAGSTADIVEFFTSGTSATSGGVVLSEFSTPSNCEDAGGSLSGDCSLTAGEFLMSPISDASILKLTLKFPSRAGYHVAQVRVGTDSCGGVFVFVHQELFNTVDFKFLHRSSSSGTNPNVWDINVETAEALNSIDELTLEVQGHSSDYLGQSSTTVYQSCAFFVGGVLRSEVVCVFARGAKQLTRISVLNRPDIATSTAIRLVLYKVFNPTNQRKMTVLLRHYKMSALGITTEVQSASAVFESITETFVQSTATLSSNPRTAASISLPVTATFSATDSAYILTSNPFCNLKQSSILSPDNGSFSDSRCLWQGSVSNPIAISNFEASYVSGSDKAYLLVVTDAFGSTSSLLQATEITSTVTKRSDLTCSMTFGSAVGNKYTYSFTFNVAIEAVKSTYVELLFPTIFADVVLESLSNQSLGVFEGTPIFSVDSVTSTLRVFKYDYLNTGSWSFDMTFRATYKSTGSLSNGACSLKSATGVDINSITGLTTTYPSAGLAIALPNSKIQIRSAVLPNSYGRMVFTIAFTATVAATSRLYVYPDSGFSISTTDKYFAKFTQLDTQVQFFSSYVVYESANSRFNISPPVISTLTLTKIFQVEISTYESANWGLRAPSVAGEFSFTFSLDNSSTSAVIETFKAPLRIPQSLPSHLSASVLLGNTVTKNLLFLHYSPSVNVPAGSLLWISLSTSVIVSGVKTSSFPYNLDASLIHKKPIKCLGYTFVFGGSKTAQTYIARCELNYGIANNLNNPVGISVVLSSALSSGTNYQIDVYNLLNGATAGSFGSVGFEARSGTSILEQSYIPNVVYFADPAVTNDASVTIATQTLDVQVSMNVNVPLNTAASVALERDYDGITLSIAPEIWTKNIAVSNSELFVHLTDLNLLSFYVYSGISTNFVLGLTNFVSPFSATTLSYGFLAYIIKDHYIQRKITYTGNVVSQPVVLTSVSLNPSSLLPNVRTVVEVSFQLSKATSATSVILFKLNAIDTIVPGCSETSSFFGSQYLCDITATDTIQISQINAIPSGSTVSVKIAVSTAQAASQNLCVRVYDDSALSKAIMSSTCASFTSTSQNGIKTIEATSFPRHKRIQAYETGPLTFSFHPSVTLTKLVDYIRVEVGTQFLKTDSTDFACFFNDLSASSCRLDSVTGTYYVYTPRETSLVKDNLYKLRIFAMRQNLFNNAPGSFPHAADGLYPVTMDFYVSAVKTGTATSISYQVPLRRFLISNLNTGLVQKSAFSLYQLKVQVPQIINAAPNGRIVITFPTSGVYTTNLGTDYYHGQMIGCIKGPTSSVDVTCQLFFGTTTSPATVIVWPKQALAVNGILDVSFPPFFNPAQEFLEVPLTVQGQNLNVAAATWTPGMEFIDYIFVAISLTYTSVSRPSPTWSPNNYVGQPSSVTFPFTADSQIQAPSAGGFDKVIITVDKSQLNFQNNQTIPAKKLSAAGWTINIYYDQDLIECLPTTTIAQGTNVNLAFTNFINQQYVIPNGVAFSLSIWSGGGIVRRYDYATNLITPNVLSLYQVTYKNLVAETGAFDTYDFQLLPNNKIPAGGYIVISMSDGFNSLTNCEIYGGMTGICKTSTVTGKTEIELDFFKAYDPVVNNKIFFKVDMNNAPTPGTYTFLLTSYYNIPEQSAGTDFAKIEQQVIFTINLIGSTPFDYFDMEPPMRWTRTSCPNNGWDFGVLQLQIGFTQTLSYETRDRINIISTELTQGDNYATAQYRELLCYFNKDKNIHSVKSEDCVRAGNSYTVMVPEELNFSSSNNYTLNIEYRGTNRGIVSSSMPKKYYIIVETNNTASSGETAIIEFPMRGCYFDNLMVDVVHWHENLRPTVELQFYSYISMNWRQGSSGNKVRIQLLFSTWNEIKETQHLDMGHTGIISWNDTQSLPCFLHTSQTSFNLDSVYLPRDVYCEIYHGNDKSLNWPISMTVNSFTDGNIGNEVRTGIGWIQNYKATPMDCFALGLNNDGNRNTFTHITVLLQNQINDGTFVDIHRATQFYAIGRILPYVDQSTLNAGGSAKMADAIFSGFNNNYQMSVSLSATVPVSYMYWKLSPPHTVKPRWRMVTLFTGQSCSHTCSLYADPIIRMLFYINANVKTITLKTSQYMEHPSFLSTVPTSLYITNNHQLTHVLNDTHTTLAVSPTMVLEHEHRDAPRSTLLRHRLLFYWSSPYTDSHKYLRIYVPQAFSDVQNCSVKFGFRSTDTGDLNRKMRCVITPAVSYLSNTYTLIEIFDIYHFSYYYNFGYECYVIVQVWLKTPSTSQWTPEWHTQWYNNYDVATNTFNSTMVQMQTAAGSNQARSWVGETVPVTNYFRVFRNHFSFEERRQSVGQWAELHMRVYPADVIPADVGLVQVQLPSTYSIPDGGTNICEVGHLNHVDLTGQFCSISNEGNIRVRTNTTQGLNQVCSLVRITTYDSVGDNNGFKAPPVFGNEEFEMYLWNDSQLLEYSGGSGAPKSEAFVLGSTLFVNTTCNEINENSVLRFRFTATTNIPAGYQSDLSTVDVSLRSPQSYISVFFNTYDLYNQNRNGFPLNLGVMTSYVPCQAVRNISPKSGESLICEVLAQSARNYYNPVEVRVQNYEMIPVNTTDVEIHLMDFTWTGSASNVGWVEIGVTQRNGDGSLDTIFSVARAQLGSQASTGIVFTTNPTAANYPVISPSTVGSKISFKFAVTVTTFLLSGDTIELSFPSQFELCLLGTVSAILQIQTPSTYRVTPASVNLYCSILKLHVMLPNSINVFGCTVGTPCTVTVVISGLRHAAYAFSTPYQIGMRVLSSLITQQKRNFINLTPPIIAPFNSLLVTLSSQSSNDIAVNYSFQFLLSYRLPAGSELRLVLNPTLFAQIDKSSPPATCSLSVPSSMTSCTVKEAVISVLTSQTLNEATPYVILLYSAKNPSFVGTTSSTDLLLTAYHPTGFKTNEGYFTQITYTAPKKVGTVFLQISLSSYYQTISTDYTFVIQNTNLLPAQGMILIKMPQNWASTFPPSTIISSLTGSFTSDKLIYSEMHTTQPSGDLLYKIFTQFDWPANSQMVIVFQGIPNPSIIQTGSFIVSTIYDGVTLDTSDSNDPSSKLTFLTYDPKMTLWDFDFWPKNEAEVAKYSLVISSADAIVSGSSINLIFPDNYDQLVVEPQRGLQCYSSKILLGGCSYGNSMVQIQVAQLVQPEFIFDLLIDSLENPNYNTFKSVSVSTVYQGLIQQFTSNLFSVITIQGAKHMPLTYLATTSLKILEKATYDFCIKVTDPIPVTASVLVDFPKQFQMRSSDYDCQLGARHDAVSLPYVGGKPVCETSMHLRRINITGIATAFPGENLLAPPAVNYPYNFCYTIKNVANSYLAQESFNFIIRIYDSASLTVLYRTFGILEYPSTLTYIMSGLMIQVSAVASFAQKTVSQLIEVTLESTVPYNVKLVPSCDGFSFLPNPVVFPLGGGVTQTFRISPNTGTPAGNYNIQWTKIEESSQGTNLFAEVVDTPFTLLSPANSQLIKILVDQLISKTPLGATSLPITLTLGQPSASTLNIFYQTIKPSQSQAVTFSPSYLVFQPGQTSASFTYTSTMGGASGLIAFSLDAEFTSTYYFVQPTINIELYQSSTIPPNIVTIKSFNVTSNSAKIRISVDKNSEVKYIIAKKGTPKPSLSSMLNPTSRPSANEEISGSKFVSIIGNTGGDYSDVFVEASNLDPNSEYEIFAVPIDQSGNIGSITSYPFSTLKEDSSVEMKMTFSSLQNLNDILNALSLATGLPTSAFTISETPSTDDPLFTSLQTEFTYTIKIDPTATGSTLSPYDISSQVSDNVEMMRSLLPDLLTTNPISASARPINYSDVNFTYGPFLTSVSTFLASFNVSTTLSSKIYAVVLLAEEPSPSPIQVKFGLNSTNNKVDSYYQATTNIAVDITEKYKIWPSDIVSFEYLYHSTNYSAYFVAENSAGLMSKDNMVRVTFQTMREIFYVDDGFVYLNDNDL